MVCTVYMGHYWLPNNIHYVNDQQLTAMAGSVLVRHMIEYTGAKMTEKHKALPTDCVAQLFVSIV